MIMIALQTCPIKKKEYFLNANLDLKVQMCSKLLDTGFEGGGGN